MPKFKSKKAARKRFRLTKTGKVKRYKAGRRHILTKKSRKRKRSLSGTPMVHKTFATQVRKMMGKR